MVTLSGHTLCSHFIKCIGQLPLGGVFCTAVVAASAKTLNCKCYQTYLVVEKFFTPNLWEDVRVVFCIIIQPLKSVLNHRKSSDANYAIFKTLGPLTKSKPNLDQKNDHAPKEGGSIFIKHVFTHISSTQGDG